MSDSLRSVWGHSVHFAKFQMLRFLKGYCSHSFHPVLTKLYERYISHGEIQAITFSGNMPNFKNIPCIQHFANTRIHFSYIDIMFKAKLISSGKRSNRGQGPWASCFKYPALYMSYTFFQAILGRYSGSCFICII